MSYKATKRHGNSPDVEMCRPSSYLYFYLVPISTKKISHLTLDNSFYLSEFQVKPFSPDCLSNVLIHHFGNEIRNFIR